MHPGHGARRQRAADRVDEQRDRSAFEVLDAIEQLDREGQVLARHRRLAQREHHLHDVLTVEHRERRVGRIHLEAVGVLVLQHRLDEVLGLHVTGHALGAVGEVDRARGHALQSQLPTRQGRGARALDEEELGVDGLRRRLLGLRVLRRDRREEGRSLAEESGDVRTLAALHGAYACVLGISGGYSDERMRYGREATRLADQTDDQGLQLAERSYLAFGCVFAGRLTEGIEVCDIAYQRLPADPALGEEFTGYSPFLGLMCTQAWMLCLLGHPEEATAVCERAEHLARLHGDYEVLTWLQLPRIELDACFADTAAASDHARSALETGERTATPQSRVAGLITLGIAHRIGSQWDESVAVLEETQLELDGGGTNRMFEGWVRAELAKALLGRGELDRAEHEAQAAATVAHAQHSRCYEVLAHLVLAHTQFQRADVAALARAEQALVRAQELVDEISAQVYQPEIYECRARLATLRGDALAAQRELKEARRLYAAMGATAQAERVERLAQELGSS